jgi:hypothetical protein
MFYDELSAKNFSRYERLIQEMRVVASQYDPCDWSDTEKEKYFIGYSPYTDEWHEYVNCRHKKVGAIHCSKKRALLKWVKSLSASDQEILKRGEL